MQIYKQIKMDNRYYYVDERYKEFDATPFYNDQNDIMGYIIKGEYHLYLKDLDVLVNKVKTKGTGIFK